MQVKQAWVENGDKPNRVTKMPLDMESIDCKLRLAATAGEAFKVPLDSPSPCNKCDLISVGQPKGAGSNRSEQKKTKICIYFELIQDCIDEVTVDASAGSTRYARENPATGSNSRFHHVAGVFKIGADLASNPTDRAKLDELNTCVSNNIRCYTVDSTLCCDTLPSLTAVTPCRLSLM